MFVSQKNLQLSEAKESYCMAKRCWGGYNKYIKFLPYDGTANINIRHIYNIVNY